MRPGEGGKIAMMIERNQIQINWKDLLDLERKRGIRFTKSRYQTVKQNQSDGKTI